MPQEPEAGDPEVAAILAELDELELIDEATWDEEPEDG